MALIIRALSVRQPWASFIAEGKKSIETRTWNTVHRGELLIVASKLPSLPPLPAGKAVAFARLSECRRMRPSDEARAMCARYPRAFSWVLDDVRPIKVPFSVKGQLGLYYVKIEPIEGGSFRTLPIRERERPEEFGDLFSAGKGGL